MKIFEKEFCFQMKIVNYITTLVYERLEWRGKFFFKFAMNVYVILCWKKWMIIIIPLSQIYSVCKVKCGIKFWQNKLFLNEKYGGKFIIIIVRLVMLNIFLIVVYIIRWRRFLILMMMLMIVVLQVLFIVCVY